MGERMHRTQILIEPEQHRALSDLAKEERKSVSEVVREILREYFENRSVEARWKNRDKTLLRAQRVRKAIMEERDGKPIGLNIADVIVAMREERVTGLLSAFEENDNENRD